MSTRRTPKKALTPAKMRKYIAANPDGRPIGKVTMVNGKHQHEFKLAENGLSDVCYCGAWRPTAPLAQKQVEAIDENQPKKVIPFPSTAQRLAVQDV